MGFGANERLGGGGMGEVTQIGLPSFPACVFQPVTNDLADHSGLPFSANGDAMTTVETETSTEIVLASDPKTPSAARVPGISPQDRVPAFAWAQDGQLLISFGYRLVRQPSSGANPIVILKIPRPRSSIPRQHRTHHHQVGTGLP